MTPKRPYIVRAFHEWIEDNDFTPYLMIDATRWSLGASRFLSSHAQSTNS